MPKKKTNTYSVTALKQECKAIFQDAVYDIKQLCREQIATVQIQRQQARAKIKKLQQQTKTLTSKQKELNKRAATKTTKALTQSLSKNKAKLKTLAREQSQLEKQVVKFDAQIEQFKILSARQQDSIRAWQQAASASVAKTAPKARKSSKPKAAKPKARKTQLPLDLLDTPPLKVGMTAPALTAGLVDDQPVTWDQFKGKNVVLFFYPKDNTPGCTKEAIDFSQQIADFAAQDTLVVGVSRDSCASHQRFAAKHNLDLTLISDPTEEICRAFGVLKKKNMYGKTAIGIERSTFVIDKQGRVSHIWRGVKVPDHASTVLAELS